MSKISVLIAVAGAALALPVLPACAQNPAPAAQKSLVNLSGGDLSRFTPSTSQVTVARGKPSGVAVNIAAGDDGYPGVAIKPEGAVWDLSKYGHVEARVMNTGSKPLMIALRVDNAGDWKDNPWNSESINLQPGESGTITVLFGYSYGKKPGYALKPAAVSNLLLFTTKTDAAESFRIDSLTAAGPAGEKPPVAPQDVRIKPSAGGVMYGNVPGVALESVLITSSANSGERMVAVRPPSGRWDLRDYLQVQVSVTNTGTSPVTPRVRLDTDGGSSDWVVADSPIAAGATQTLTIPFIPSVPADMEKKDTTGARIASNAVAAVMVSVPNAATEQKLRVDSAKAVMPPAPKLPDWLGKRPPVAGDWVQTFDDEFDGTAINPALWDTEGENYYDKNTHWSKDNVIVGGGVARLRYEKKTGYQNDDPKRNKTDYAAGFLNGYGKWVQRYGYFEARIKAPTAPGLWPAFWMMPERGTSVGVEQWKRQDTKNGGMEFDIFEQLTGWGPTRYNIAMHYDGYEKEHKSLGTDKIYVQPDRDGFVTCGLLWTPGSAVYYCNGVEVLRWENPRVGSVPSTMMFTLPSGGWDNTPLEDAKLPADFVIDYVRVWQRKDLASSADSKPVLAKKVAGK